MVSDKTLTNMASELIACGLSIIPVENKKPTIAWKPFQVRLPKQNELNYVGGIALVCGRVSGNVEVIDVDVKNDPRGTLVDSMLDALEKACPELTNDNFVVQRTPSGGCHIIYKCERIERNQVLAKSKEGRALIETRGEGGYVCIAPTAHYELTVGTFSNISKLSIQQRDKIIEACRTLNEYPQKKPTVSSKNPLILKDTSPWIDYNKRGDIPTLLKRHGWTFIKSEGENESYCRPGKKGGASAHWSEERRLLYVFTTSTVLEGNTHHTPFDVFTTLECNGDAKEAARRLRKLGYGSLHKPVTTIALEALDESSLNLEYLRITDCTNIPEPAPVVTINKHTICAPGDITVISGPSKSGKSAILQIILSQAITQDGVISDPIPGLQVMANSQRFGVIHIDTEQARWKHKLNLQTILRRGYFDTCPEYFLSYNMRRVELSDYKKTTFSICEKAHEQFGGIHLIVIDGMADYIEDVNDAISSNALVRYFENLAITYNCPIITIIHLNPGVNGKERGHLGSQCQRKAGSVLGVDKVRNTDITYLKPKFLRYAGNSEVPTISLQYDPSKGYHTFFRMKLAVSEKQKTTTKTKDLEQAAKEVFENNSLGYSEAIKAICERTKKKARTAKERFKQMKENNLIIRNEDGLWLLNLIKSDADTE